MNIFRLFRTIRHLEDDIRILQDDVKILKSNVSPARYIKYYLKIIDLPEQGWIMSKNDVYEYESKNNFDLSFKYFRLSNVQ